MIWPRRTLLLLIALVGMSSCEGVQRQRATPRELIGVWESDDIRYLGRTFEFRDSSVIFTTGDNYWDFTAHPILDVTSNTTGNSVEYLIKYGTMDGGELRFSFTFFPLDGGYIRFTNQPLMTWTRVPSDSGQG